MKEIEILRELNEKYKSALGYFLPEDICRFCPSELMVEIDSLERQLEESNGTDEIHPYDLNSSKKLRKR